MSVMRVTTLAVAGLLPLTASCAGGGSGLTQVESSKVGTPPATPSIQPVTDTESFLTALESAGYKVKEGRTVRPGFWRFR
jgi:hypothetical protein